jgi:predicted dehydrogenase
MPDRIRIAVIGCGFQGSYHAANVISHERTELVVCCDTERSRAEGLATRYGTLAASDPDVVLADPRVDAVIVATTTNTHRSLALAAAAAGKDILLEKPMALDVAECLDIERAVANAGVTLMIGYKFRFMAAVVAARQAVPHPLVLTAHTLYDHSQNTSSWVNDRSLSGGRVMSSLVHSIDLLSFLAGCPITAVTGAGGNLAIDGLDDIDTLVATLEFESGAVASLVHGTAGESPLLSVWSFQTAARGVNATIHAHGRRMRLHDTSVEPDPPELIDPIQDPFAAGTAELLDAFVGAVDAGGATSAGPRDGTMAVLISRAIEEAVASGRRVTIRPPGS